MPTTQLFAGFSSPVAVGGSDDDLVLVQPLDIFGRVSATRSVGDAEVARANAELRQELVNLQSEVLTQFQETAAAHAFANSAEMGLSLAESLRGAIKILVEEGRLPGVQLTRVGIEVDRARLIAEQRNADYRASAQRLSGLLGVPIAEVQVTEFAEVSVEPTDPRLLSASRTDLLLLAVDVALAEAQSRVARLSGRPVLEVQGRRTAWQDSTERYGIRVQLSFPLNDFGKARAETAAAQLQVEAGRKALHDAVGIAVSELEAARIELESARKLVDRHQQMVLDTRSLVEVSRVGFADRVVTLIELLDATRALREVELEAIEARLRLAQAQASYLGASGRLLEVGK